MFGAENCVAIIVIRENASANRGICSAATCDYLSLVRARQGRVSSIASSVPKGLGDGDRITTRSSLPDGNTQTHDDRGEIATLELLPDGARRLQLSDNSRVRRPPGDFPVSNLRARRIDRQSGLLEDWFRRDCALIAAARIAATRLAEHASIRSFRE